MLTTPQAEETKRNLYGSIVNGKLTIEKTPAQQAAEDAVREQALALDPIRYELFSHSLYQVLEEGQEVMRRVGISPIVRYTGESVFAVYTADGDCALTVAGILLHVAGNAYVVKFILQEQPDDIRDGDQWFSNDPAIGGLHAPDQALVAPIFYQGELLCWIGSLTHVPEVGAIEPGGICPSATERFHEGLLVPAVKIVDAGTQRRDVWRLLQWSGREAQTVTLDNVAKVAGNVRAKKRILELVERFGADFVRLALRRLIMDSERLARAKIAKLADGRYYGRVFMDNDGTGRKHLWHAQCLATVQGDRLTLDYSGTAPWNRGACNCAVPGTLGGIFSALCGQLFFDMNWNQGLFNAARLILPEGSVLNPPREAAVGLCPGQPAEAAIGAVQQAINRARLASGFELGDINAGYAAAVAGITYGGLDQYGRTIASHTVSHMGAGFGAKWDGDGVDSAGRVWCPESDCSEVELYEHHFPVLYLERGHLRDGYGFGEYRGGCSNQETSVIHKARSQTVRSGSWANGQHISITRGFLGGYPSPRTVLLRAKGTDFGERARRGERLPHHADDLAAWGREHGVAVEEAPTPSPYTLYENGDIQHLRLQGGGGLGDPLLRDPRAVCYDLRTGMLSLTAAPDVYGVVVDTTTWTVNEEETTARRQALRADRRARGHFWDGRPPVGALREILAQPLPATGARYSKYLGVIERAGSEVLACLCCGYEFGAPTGDWKLRVLTTNRDPREIFPYQTATRAPEPKWCIYREYYCPGCATMFEVEPLPRGYQDEPPRREVWLARYGEAE